MKQLTAALTLFLACAPTPKLIAKGDAPEQTQRATAAFSELRTKLMERLTAALNGGDPASAIEVCSIEAPGLADEVAAKHGLKVGRTSFRLRNQTNAPRPWAAARVAEAGKTPERTDAGAVLDLGDRVGVLEPIVLAPLCVSCHGPRESLGPPVAAALSARYPDDRAVDFTPGQLRGFFWAEVPKAR